MQNKRINFYVRKGEKMKTTRKKLIVSLCALGIIVVAALVATVSVMAAINTNVKNKFSITYTAYGVAATVQANYRVANVGESASGEYTTLTVSGEIQITFTGSESTESDKTKTFDDLGAVDIAKNQYFVFKYEITNNSTNDDMTVNLNIEETTTPENFKVFYAYTTDSTDISTNLDLTTLGTEGNAFQESFTPQTIAKGEGSTFNTGYVYVVLAIENPDVNASFEGTSNWSLSAV